MGAVSMFEVRKKNRIAGKGWSQDSNPGRLAIERTMAALCSSHTVSGHSGERKWGKVHQRRLAEKLAAQEASRTLKPLLVL